MHACAPLDWLLAVMLAAIGVLVCSVLLRRMRKLEAELAERERRACELHDSFLQSVQGLVLKFQHAMEEIPPGLHARTLMERALDRADQVIAEGRDRAGDLKSK